MLIVSSDEFFRKREKEMKKEQFKQLKKEFGECASFAIWQSQDNVKDISMFDDENIARELNDKYIFVALNPAERSASEKVELLKNFHSDYAHQKDFKLCYALKNTRFWGSYITDLFKSFHITDSAKLNKALKERPHDVQKDKESFLKELNILSNVKVIIALGRKTERYLKKLLNNEYEIVYVRHYSYYSSKEDYKKIVLEALKNY